MALYTYKCTKCQHESDKIQPIETRDNIIICGDCGGESVRVVSLPAPPQFRGGGFYATEYRKPPVDKFRDK